MTELERYLKVKERLDAVKKEAAKAEGAKEQITASLRDEFSVDSLEEGKKLLEQLVQKIERKKALLNKELPKIEAELDRRDK